MTQRAAVQEVSPSETLPGEVVLELKEAAGEATPNGLSPPSPPSPILSTPFTSPFQVST